MSLRYEWTVDPGNLTDGMAVSVDDGTDSGTATVTTDTVYAHTSLTSVLGSGVGGDLATALETLTDAILTTNGSTISYSAANRAYTLAFGASCTVDFRSATLGDDSGVNLAKWLGFTASHTDGAGSGYDCYLSGQTSYTSNVRPYGIIIPTIQGRSDVSDEYEPDGIAMDNEADDGSAYGVSKDTSSIWLDWTQTAETNSPPSGFASDGMAVFQTAETSAVPWSYQRAFGHARDGWYPFLVVDGSDSLVCELRAEGASFHPTRFAGKDYSLWSIPFRTRLRGRL